MGVEFLEIIDLDDARRITGKLFSELYTRGTETVDIMDAAGRVLADDTESPVDLPPFDRASRDGYAVRAADTFGADEE
ncbi:MAG TPA: molybdopterin molybdenumtransferase MoeA, partial [Methanothermobacter thermautotrophicus]|nr:molybdopterin molybdenumtransferase MoeA [Methanothermobacter thermautotrophicus]